MADDLTARIRAAAPPRRCKRHVWETRQTDDGPVRVCSRCFRIQELELTRRTRNNRKRGTTDELTVARIVGGRKMGQLGLPWDVEIPGYARLQAKQLDRWPSLNAALAWLDAIPVGNELRGVTLADTPGPGHRTRRLVLFDLEEWARWHGRGPGDG